MKRPVRAEPPVPNVAESAPQAAAFVTFGVTLHVKVRLFECNPAFPPQLEIVCFQQVEFGDCRIMQKISGFGDFWASRIQLYFEKRGQLADFRTPLALKTKQFGERKSVAVPFFTRGLIHRYQHSAYRAPWIFGLAADTC